MTIQDIRRARLAQLIAERYKSQADFVSSTGENQGEVSGLLKTKSFGEKKARKIESKAGLPAGWLDEPIEADGGAADQAAPTNAQGDAAPEWMAPEAYRLLTLYYSSSLDHRAEIMATAEEFAAADTAARVVHHQA